MQIQFDVGGLIKDDDKGYLMWRGKVTRVMDNQDMDCNSIVSEYIVVAVQEKDKKFSYDTYDAKEIMIFFRGGKMDVPNHPDEGDIVKIYRKRKDSGLS